MYVENWRKLAAAVVLQAAIDYVNPRPVVTKNEKILYKQSAREFFTRAAERGPERVWFDALGIRPLALAALLEGGACREQLALRLPGGRQVSGKRAGNGGSRARTH